MLYIVSYIIFIYLRYQIINLSIYVFYYVILPILPILFSINILILLLNIIMIMLYQSNK